MITSFSSRSGVKTRRSHGRIRKTIIFIRSVSLMMLWSASFSSSHVIKLREKAGLNGIARQISFGGSSVFFESSHSSYSYHVDKTIKRRWKEWNDSKLSGRTSQTYHIITLGILFPQQKFDWTLLFLLDREKITLLSLYNIE